MALKSCLLPRLAASAAFVAFAAGTVAAKAGSPPAPQPGSFQAMLLDAESLGSLGPLGPFVATPEPPGDTDYLPKILAAYRDGDIAEADILRSKLTRPAGQALAEWFAIRSGIPIGLDRLMAFGRDYPDWPVASQVRRRTEEALLNGRRSPARVRAFFQDQAPVSGAGRLALAFALKADGLDAEAANLIRTAWREDTFGSEMESRILDEFPGVLVEADHRHRMERLLFREAWGGALRAAGRAGPGYATLVQARMGLYQGKKKAEKAFAAVPASLRGDASYIFSRALYLRRQKKFGEAAQVMAQAPRDPEALVEGDQWWNERRLIARELLDLGDAKAAYAVASHHGAEKPAQRIEAEFHAGWIALRFLEDAAAAERHFTEASAIAATPISVARAAYWQGRAAEAAGRDTEAARFFQRAADQPITFYGQLARAKLNRPVELRKPERLDGNGRRSFEALVPVQALRLLQQIGETELALALYSDLAQSLGQTAQLDALSAIAEEAQNPRAMLVVGKLAVQRGFPLDAQAYPTIGIPSFDPVGDRIDPAMVFAIARQESAFNPKALSSAGARGLMQLMPATAKRTAQRFGVGFDVKRLTEDPAYNAKIGSAHLGELMEDWKGSHILAFASYNAGGGNVAKWVRAYGDPRKAHVDWIDWVERIPFHETRNYVQRVMENLTVYRHRLSAEAVTADALPKGDDDQYE